MSWEGWEAATCLPDHCFCEGLRDGLIRQPANTWSNLGFCFAGVLMAYELSRGRAPRGLRRSEAALFALATFLVGVTSAFYHASLTFLGQWLDVQSMYLLVLLVVAVNFDAARPAAPKRALPMYFSLNAVLAVMLIVAPVARRYAFGVAILAVIVSEVWLRRRNLRVGSPRPLLIAVGLQALAFVIWILDLTHTVCEPTSLLQGHAIWHLLGAGAAYFLWRSTGERGGLALEQPRE